MDDLYQQIILDHYKHPHNYGVVKNATHTSKGTNASCGDQINISLIYKNGHITDLKFTGEGCAISIAATSLLTDRIKNQELNIGQINKLITKDIEHLLGIGPNPSREKCITIGLVTLKQILYQNP